MIIEKRKFERVNTENLLSFIKFTNNGFETLESLGISQNISEAGVLFKSTMKFNVGDEIRIDFAYEENIVTIIGEIVRFEKIDEIYNKVSVQFKSLSEKDKDIIRKIIERKKNIN